jgi:hypothetical protein
VLPILFYCHKSLVVGVGSGLLFCAALIFLCTQNTNKNREQRSLHAGLCWAHYTQAFFFRRYIHTRPASIGEEVGP